MLVSTDWLKEYVNTGLSPQKLSELITMGGVEVEEIVGGDVLHLAPTPNRGDCLSILGVAREVSALTGKKINLPKVEPPKGERKMSDFVDVTVKDKKGCPRYTARVIDGVKVGPSPDWLKKRVESAGVRSINNIIDATNFVLMELGQPVHAFDLKLLKGGKLIIDRPKKDLTLKALDEQEYTFTPDDILNMDARRAIGAAGIMGGENSGVRADTTTLVLESAYFDPTVVRKTSKRTGLISESSKRFEKSVDPEFVINALHRLTRIILEVAGGVASLDWVDLYPKPFKRSEIIITTDRINWLLGTEIDRKTAEHILVSIGCDVEVKKGGTLSVVAPFYRPDLTRPIDLVEEVARLYGYDNIKESMPVTQNTSIIKPPAIETENIVRATLSSLGFHEALTYSFASKLDENRFGASKALRLANPLNAEMLHMRTSMLPGLLASLKGNLSRQISDVKLFELNRVFLAKGSGLPEERLKLVGLLSGQFMPGCWEKSGREVNLFDAKGALSAIFESLGLKLPSVSITKGIDFLHPVDSFTISLDDDVLGYCGRLHPSLEREYDLGQKAYIFEVDFDMLKMAYLGLKTIYRPISRFPMVTRDVALLVDKSITHKELLQSFNKHVSNLVKQIELFDIYEGKGIPDGKKSMAYRVSFGSDDRTLGDLEVDEAFSGLVEFVVEAFGAEVR